MEIRCYFIKATSLTKMYTTIDKAAGGTRDGSIYLAARIGITLWLVADGDRL